MATQSVADLVKVCQEQTIRHILHRPAHSRNTLSEYNFQDKRQQSKLVKELVKGGYIALIMDQDENGNIKEVMEITSKAYKELKAADPGNLVNRFTFKPQDRQTYMLPLDSFFTLAEQKFILENCTKVTDTYQLMIFAHPTNWNENPELVSATLGKVCDQQKEYEKRNRVNDAILGVTTAALRAFYLDSRDKATFEEMAGKNLPWGLQKLGILPEEEAEKVKNFDNEGLFYSGHRFKTDRSKWGSQLEDGIARVEKEIEEAQATLARYRKIKEGVEARGGWDAFVTEYEAALRVAMDEKG